MNFDLFTQPRIHAKGYTPSEQDTKRIARSASAMNAKVLALFLDNPNTGYIAPEVHAIVGGLLTSVRRTLTDLMNEGLLVKTGHRRKGAFGVENCEYKLNTNNDR
jgi:Fic family protein